MRRRDRTSGAALAVCAVASLVGQASAGSVSTAVAPGAAAFGLQPTPTAISVCFVGDALVSRADRVAQITRALRGHAEAAANLRFSGFGTCGPPTRGTCGADSHACDQYPGDIRIALDGTRFNGQPVTRVIPASYTDCADHGASSSWSMFPDVINRSDRRACPYNAAIGDDADTSVSPPVPWLNHPLHEVGHALGLQHEFLQRDFFNFIGPNGLVCGSSTTQPSGDGLTPLTVVDAFSVMMYVDASCAIQGNYAQTGYSALDRLSLHILYPEPVRVAEYTGVTVVRAGEPVSLAQLWTASGARSQMIGSIRWTIGDASSSTASFSHTWISAGPESGTLSYSDFLGRSYSVGIEVRVLSADDFTAQVSGPVAAALPLL